MDDGHSA
jgi:hypothetical protein